ncbi:hypothetical protein [Halogeometricum limi]|uniref:Uncharacterized protein n=1 Tax=Halogeometricum limi TaxID=555875 RepID=A0A1I6H9G1_9EURY|nr:hypothetical protein [Halogeometricum limi]SFR50990.1 hypothetical protein SAMN04488124_1940 [Halogeometricum limi]
MNRERVVVLLYCAFFASVLVENAVSLFLGDGGWLQVAFVLLVGVGLVVFAREYAADASDESITRITENDAWFWAMVVALSLFVVANLYDLSRAV